MKAGKLVFALTAALAMGTAFAQSGADVVKAKGCLNCHDVDKKKVGPSFKDIAAKKKPAAEMVAKLKEGKGHMKVAASDDELKKLVDYVNATK